MTWSRKAITEDPPNLETDPAAFAKTVTPPDALFLRSHGTPPPGAGAGWKLRIEGHDQTALELSVADLRRFPTKKITMVLECAGNGRRGMQPPVPGVAWGDDAVGCASFRGVPLRSLLPKTSPDAQPQEIVFVGADQDEASRRFERSLPLEKALDRDTLVAFEMDGHPIPREHGGPVRLVVPGWYGVASVKWLRTIRPSEAPFQGHYQTESYVYRRRDDGGPDRPVRALLVKSMIVAPSTGSRVPVDRSVRVWGWSWTGSGKVVQVDVSADGGETWRRARLGSSLGSYAWRRWSFSFTPRRSGACEVLARASDSRGATQPLKPVWNEGGYGNNAVARVRLDVSGSPGTGKVAAAARRRLEPRRELDA